MHWDPDNLLKLSRVTKCENRNVQVSCCRNSPEFLLPPPPPPVKTLDNVQVIPCENTAGNYLEDSVWVSGRVDDVVRALGDTNQRWCWCANNMWSAQWNLCVTSGLLHEEPRLNATEISVLLCTCLTRGSSAAFFICERQPLEKAHCADIFQSSSLKTALW